MGSIRLVVSGQRSMAGGQGHRAAVEEGSRESRSVPPQRRGSASTASRVIAGPALSTQHSALWNVVAVAWSVLVGLWPGLVGGEVEPAMASGERVLCLKAAVPPQIDGSLDDECWAQAGRFSHFVEEKGLSLGEKRGHVAVSGRISAWIAHDEGNLYVAFQCEEPGPAGPSGGREEASGLVFEGAVHVLVAKEKFEEPLHLAIDGLGIVEKVSGPEGALLDYRQARGAAARNEQGWGVELAIPFVGESPPEGEAWRLNLGWTSPKRRGAAGLACTYGGMDDAMSFAEMEFAEQGVVLRDLDLGDERGDWGGPPVGRATVRNSSKAALVLTLQAIVVPGGEAFGPPEFTLAPGEERGLEWQYQVKQASGNRMTVVIGGMDGRPRWVAFERPLRDQYLSLRLARIQGLLGGYAGYLAQAIVNLREFAVFGDEVRRMGEGAAALKRKVESAEGERQQCEEEVERLEEATARIGVLVSILESYTLTEKTAGAMGRKFAFFSLPVFEMATYLTMPGPEQVAKGLKARACPGERKGVSFQVASAEPLPNVSLEATDLVGEGGKLSQGELNLWVVKCWYQGGEGWGEKPEEKVLVPELLLKDDREPLVGRRPALRLEGQVVTDIPAGVSKQFWLTIRVPEDAAAGTYRGEVVLDAPGRTAYTMPLEVEVLPFNLVEPRQRLAVYFLGRLGGEGRMTLAEYQRQLRDICEHGFGQAGIADGPDFLAQALTLRSVEALTEEAVWMAAGAPGGGLPDVSKEASGPPLACQVELAEGLEERAAAIHASGGKTFATIERTLSPDEAAVLDFGCFQAESPLFARHLGKKDEGTWEPSSAMEYYSWDAWREEPLKNRLLCGVYLWRWGLDGAMPYVYQEVVGDDPYEEATAAGNGRRHMLTYPSLRGPVATLQWEACREGIYDLRYAATLEFWLEKARREVNRLMQAGEDSGSPRAQALMKAYAEGKGTLDRSRERISVHPDEALQRWTAQSFDDLREEVIDRIVELQGVVEGGQDKDQELGEKVFGGG